MVLICPPDPGVTQTEAQHKMARNTKTQKFLEYKTQTGSEQNHKKTIIKKGEQIVSYSACTTDVVYDACDGVGNGGVMMMMILVIVVYGHVGVSKLLGLLFL